MLDVSDGGSAKKFRHFFGELRGEPAGNRLLGVEHALRAFSHGVFRAHLGLWSTFRHGRATQV
jgi:hypothetical protein